MGGTDLLAEGGWLPGSGLSHLGKSSGLQTRGEKQRETSRRSLSFQPLRGPRDGLRMHEVHACPARSPVTLLSRLLCSFPSSCIRRKLPEGQGGAPVGASTLLGREDGRVELVPVSESTASDFQGQGQRQRRQRREEAVSCLAEKSAL